MKGFKREDGWIPESLTATCALSRDSSGNSPNMLRIFFLVWILGFFKHFFIFSTEFSLWSSENGEIISSVLSVSEWLYLLSIWVEMKLLCIIFQICQILVWRLSFVARCSSNINLTICFSLAKVAVNMHGWYKRIYLPCHEKEISLHQLKIYWRAASLLVWGRLDGW